MDPISTSPIKAVLKRMSESVFMGLCDKLGTSQLVAMRRDVMDIRDAVLDHVTTSDDDSLMVSGSYREGFRLKGSDRDFMMWSQKHRVIWDLSQSQYYNTHRHTLILCDCSDSPQGYTLLYLLSPSRNQNIQRTCFRENNRLYISSSKYGKTWSSAVFPDPTPHGPCVSVVLSEDTLELDCALCFVSDFWPCPSSWVDRCQSWPQPHVVDDLVTNGCHFVAIGHTLGHYVHNEWRISFSLAEHKLVCAMNHCQFLTYGLLKLFLREIINNGLGDDDDKLLCSYHMKTAVFWVIQQNTLQHWCPQTLLECFWVCFKLILKWVYEGVCPNFFIPQNNMFLSKVHGEAQHQLFIRLYGLSEKGLAFLLHSPSIRSCIINVLHNPHLSICTDEHTLISEAKFDRELFQHVQEIYAYDSLYIPNLEICMRSLHTIEQMKGLPLLTQYQAVMLQKLTAAVLQKAALLLHMETYTHKNKLRYRADKISCHMLKLAAKFGCISDMLYIAMYFYKTLRYMEALTIIEMSKVKLAKPYVIYIGNVDSEMYTKAVGGHSWSTKMRQAVACNILLENKIHYINELLPEQMSSLQDNLSVLCIPQFILLYMLEIFCYRHVDTRRVQTALDDLHTLVYYDQGQIIPLLSRDISWQILGICQQVTGNLQAALYSFQQSLRQKPHHKIHTATEMRIQGTCH
ncbi:uncharacterized protein LOC134269558 [Saccostrea cucullata]|uniref:uncharacterized protein LOC134269558 n=1 Tax=Saccostrea cuccullata TaxID=36930 RepID=UPI002ED01890